MIKHLFEIKYRLSLIIFSTLIFLLFSYYYSKFFLILTIFSNNELIKNNILNYFIFTSITDLFLTHFNLSICITNYLIYFKLFYHLICFTKPGLYKKEFFSFKKLFFINVYLSIFSFIVCHVIILPIMSKFFLGFGFLKNSYINVYFEANIYNYTIFYKEILFNCFLNFQIFTLFFLGLNYYIHNFQIFKKIRKFIYLILLIISTLITPPDLISQISTFFSVVVLFEISILFSVLKKTSKKLNCYN